MDVARETSDIKGHIESLWSTAMLVIRRYERGSHLVPFEEVHRMDQALARLDSLQQQLAAEREKRERLEAALRAVEWELKWCGTAHGGEYVAMCQMCDQTPKNDHAPDCLIGGALSDAPSPPQPSPREQRLEAALRALASEVSANLSLAEANMRVVGGNTNVNCLKSRLAEAYELLHTPAAEEQR